MSKNIAASVRARLTNQAKASGRPLQELLQYYGLERFLYRFSQSPYRDRFILKGALMLRVWESSQTRPTRDIDLLGFVDNDLATVEAIFREVCELDVPEDGLFFDAATLAVGRIKEDADYEGVRVKFMGLLDRVRLPMQIDIGFGDAVVPGPEERDYPVLLDFPAPSLRVYPRETLIAEKFHAMVQLGSLNSRMKDFFDIWLLSRQFDFTGPALSAAFEATFRARRTTIDANPLALTEAFLDSYDKRRQWDAFVRRSNLTLAPESLAAAGPQLRLFLLPIAEALASAEPFEAIWTAPGPWEIARRMT